MGKNLKSRRFERQWHKDLEALFGENSYNLLTKIAQFKRANNIFNHRAIMDSTSTEPTTPEVLSNSADIGELIQIDSPPAPTLAESAKKSRNSLLPPVTSNIF